MMKEDGSGPKKRAGESREMITENLKKVYRETLEEDIPEQLKDLLARLEESDREGKKRK